jgi:hypothetical protein
MSIKESHEGMMAETITQRKVTTSMAMLTMATGGEAELSSSGCQVIPPDRVAVIENVTHVMDLARYKIVIVYIH